MRSRRCGYIYGVYFCVIHQGLGIIVPFAYVVPLGVVGGFGGIAAHNCNKFAIGHFIKCRAAFYFGYIAATYYSPVDGVHDRLFCHCEEERRSNLFAMHWRRGCHAIARNDILEFISISPQSSPVPCWRIQYYPGILMNRSIVRVCWHRSIPMLYANFLISTTGPFAPVFGRAVWLRHQVFLFRQDVFRLAGWFVKSRWLSPPSSPRECRAGICW